MQCKSNHVRRHTADPQLMSVIAWLCSTPKATNLGSLYQAVLSILSLNPTETSLSLSDDNYPHFQVLQTHILNGQISLPVSTAHLFCHSWRVLIPTGSHRTMLNGLSTKTMQQFLIPHVYVHFTGLCCCNSKSPPNAQE